MKRYKKPSIVFLVLNVVFFVAAVACFVVQGFVTEGVAPMDYFKGTWNITVEFFKFQFWQGVGLYITITIIAILAILVILLIIGIVLSIKRKRARLIWYAVMVVLTSALAILVTVNGETYWNVMLNPALGKTINVVLSDCVFGGGVLAYIFMILTFSFGLVYAKHFYDYEPAPEVAPVEQEAPVQEEPVAEATTEDVNEEAFAMPAAAEEEVAVEPVEEEKNEPMADFVSEPAQINAQPEEIIVEEIPLEKENPENAPVTKDELTSILKDIVRDIVRDEIARNGARDDDRPSRRDAGSITGASFGGPLVVQYFNGGIQPSAAPAAPAPVAPAPAPAPVAPAPAPVAPAPVAPAPAPKANNRFQKKEPAPAPVAPAPVAPAPVEPVAAPVEQPAEKKKIVRIPFQERLFAAEKDMKDNYNELKSEFVSWGLHSRVSNSGDTFRLHTKTYAKLTVAGKSLKIYFALDPKDYADSTIPFQDASNKGLYIDIPFVFKVKSPLSVKRAKALIKECCEKDGLTQKQVEANDWIKELKAELKGTKK